MIKSFSIWVTIILGWFLCLKQTNERVIVDVEKVTDMSGNRQDWDKVVKRWEYVCLEMGEQAGEIKDFSVCGEYLIVTDQWKNENRLLLYNQLGKFICRLGMLPSGEYLISPREIVWNPFRKQFLIFEGIIGKKAYVYDSSGKYIRTIECPTSWAFFGGAVFFGADSLLGYNQIGMRSEPACFVSDAGLKNKKILRRHEVLWAQGFYNYAIHPISIYRKRALAVMPFCDTIFEYRKGVMCPAFVMKEHTSLPAGTVLKAETNYRKVSRLYQEQGYYQKSDIFETNRQICLVYDNGKLFWNKKRNEGVFIPRDSTCFADFIPPLDIYGQSGEALVTCMTFEELQQWQEKMKQEGIRGKNPLLKLFREISRSKVVVFYYYL